MRCPFCAHDGGRVVDSREVHEGRITRRRRECTGCRKRYTTYEYIERAPAIVVKKDGRREQCRQDQDPPETGPWLSHVRRLSQVSNLTPS